MTDPRDHWRWVGFGLKHVVFMLEELNASELRPTDAALEILEEQHARIGAVLAQQRKHGDDAGRTDRQANGRA